ncbi:MAG TPA: ABC transporter ATP-binding protein [Anaerolineae bacterium]|nr:ABC transporter ATP-binding protein [Anaerolineae bacterium]
MAPSLSTSALSKTYGTGPAAVHALKPTDLTVRRGECLAIVGPSGSGKSTLLHLLAGLDRPSSGQVHVDGTDLYRLADDDLAIFRRRHIGFVFQFFNLIPVLSAEENITLPLLLDGRQADAALVDELLDTLGLAARRHHLPDALSGGQQQRVAIGRALVTHPAVVFADEPTGNLDTEAAGEVLELLTSAAHRYGQTVVIVTHDPHVAAHAGRVITLRDGQIVSDMGGQK